MEFLEKDLEQIIFEADRDLLKKHGLNIQGKIFRQLKIGNYGIADLVTIKKPKYCEIIESHNPIEITIYELKKENIGISTFLQALRYAKGISSYFDSKYEFDSSPIFKIVCIGKEIDLKSSYIYLSDFFLGNDDEKFFVENYTYKYGVDGIKFELHKNYRLIKEGF